MNHSKAYEKLVRSTIETIVGYVSDFSYYEKKDGSGCISFRPQDRGITLPQLIQLSEALGTDAIDFDFGHSGEPGYSEYTPGTDASPGEVKIYLPITLKEDTHD
jgi:hypothetical protein